MHGLARIAYWNSTAVDHNLFYHRRVFQAASNPRILPRPGDGTGILFVMQNDNWNSYCLQILRGHRSGFLAVRHAGRQHQPCQLLGAKSNSWCRLTKPGARYPS